MIFCFDDCGNPLSVYPEKVYRGSNKAGSVCFVAPFSADDCVSVAFSLPDGTTSERKIMDFPSFNGEERFFDGEGRAFNVWTYKLTDVITKNSGNVTLQFFVSDEGGEIISTAEAHFTVERGVEFEEVSGEEDLVAEISAVLAGFSGNISDLDDKVERYKTQGENFVTDYALSKTPDGENPILDAENKISDIYMPPEIVSCLKIAGAFSAAQNIDQTSVNLAAGDCYICSVGGYHNPDGSHYTDTFYRQGDIAVYQVGIGQWYRIINSESVLSVNEQSGHVSTYKGMYNSGITYYAGDIIFYSGSLYLVQTFVGGTSNKSFQNVTCKRLGNAVTSEVENALLTKLDCAPDGEHDILTAQNKIADRYLPDSVFDKVTSVNGRKGDTSTLVGVYVAATAYHAGDIIINGANYYLVTKDITAANNLSFSDLHKINLTAVKQVNGQDGYVETFKSVYAAGRAYHAGDFIEYGNRIYMVLNDITAANNLSFSDLVCEPLSGVTGIRGSAEANYRRGDVVMSKSDIGLDRVDNTSDSEKPVSSAQGAALAGKVDKIIPGTNNSLLYMVDAQGEQGAATLSVEPYSAAVVLRDDYGRVYFNAPVLGGQGATKDYVDGFVGVKFTAKKSNISESDAKRMVGVQIHLLDSSANVVSDQAYDVAFYPTTSVGASKSAYVNFFGDVNGAIVQIYGIVGLNRQNDGTYRFDTVTGWASNIANLTSNLSDIALWVTGYYYI